jgi:hypothetical protein
VVVVLVALVAYIIDLLAIVSNQFLQQYRTWI